MPRCWASATGLNNIPTTDVTPDKALVVQGWLATADGSKPVYMTGFKYGILGKAEAGIDSMVGSEEAGPVAAQFKLKIFEHEMGFAALGGAEGMTFNEDIDENIVPYVAVSQDIKYLRFHGGYNFQKDNFGIFGGADATFPVFDEKLTVRGDLKQVDDGNELLASAGFLLTLPFDLILESWISIPSMDEANESVTVKLNYVISF